MDIALKVIFEAVDLWKILKKKKKNRIIFENFSDIFVF